MYYCFSHFAILAYSIHSLVEQNTLYTNAGNNFQRTRCDLHFRPYRGLTLANVFFSHLLCSSGDASTNSFTCLRTFSNVVSSCAVRVSSFPSPLPISMDCAQVQIVFWSVHTSYQSVIGQAWADGLRKRSEMT